MKHALFKSISLFVMLFVLIITGVNAEILDNETSTPDVLDNETTDEISTPEFTLDNETWDIEQPYLPVERFYSLDNRSWKKQAIELRNTDNSNTTIYIKTVNNADKHFDMNIYHYFKQDDDIFRCHSDFKHLNYELNNNNVWSVESMFTGEWTRTEYMQTTSFRYKSHTFVNDIEALTTRYEKIDIEFWDHAKPSKYLYTSKIYIVGAYHNDSIAMLMY